MGRNRIVAISVPVVLVVGLATAAAFGAFASGKGRPGTPDQGTSDKGTPTKDDGPVSPPYGRPSGGEVVLASAAPAKTGSKPGGKSAPASSAVSVEQLWTARCATCHGKDGQGTAEYKTPLVGERSVAQLADVIQKTMPEDDPGTLSAKDAAGLAEYIHRSFYSATARERNRPARIELARLTVRQYRNAVADVVGAFRGAAPRWGDVRGLRGEYFKNRRFNTVDRVLERTDPEVDFDFGEGSPVEGKIDAHEFSIRWNGSVLAPETGEYEIIVRTEHAVRLWLNDNRVPLIDAWVKSGNDSEYKGHIFLVGGRIYPLRMEYSKAKQGVNDANKKAKTPPKPVKSSFALHWRVPGRTPEPVASRFLSPAGAPETCVVATPFPPDDRSYGWERGTTVSKEWDQSATEAALEASVYVAEKINELAGTKDGAPDRGAKLRDFAKRFAERAFRRPLTDPERQLVVDKQFAAAGNDDVLGVRRSVVMTLKSPRFLYRELGGSSPSFDTAARLSFGLWDSVPDQELWNAAAEGRLATREQVAAQAERMLADPRARAKLRGFLTTWLRADHGMDIGKNPKAFPGFDAAMPADLRASLEIQIDDIVWSRESDWRRLLDEEAMWVNPRMAKFYGLPLPEGAKTGWHKVKTPGRAGVLTHPYLMTSFSHDTDTSPIHRGVFVVRAMLGVALRPPPEAVAPLAPSLHPSLTTRERVNLQTRPAACMTCHNVINPLGFPLEQFDAVGRMREQDRGKPVDATGGYRTREGRAATFNGAREMAAFLTGSGEAHAAFVEQMFHHLAQQPVRAYGGKAMEDLTAKFAGGGFNVRKLAVEVMVATAPIARGGASTLSASGATSVPPAKTAPPATPAKTTPPAAPAKKAPAPAPVKPDAGKPAATKPASGDAFPGEPGQVPTAKPVSGKPAPAKAK